MSTLYLQVKSEGTEHLLVIPAIPQPGVPQEVFETDAPSSFQVGYFFTLYLDSFIGNSPKWILVLHLLYKPLGTFRS